MTLGNQDVSRGVVAYLGFGVSVSPRRDGDGVVENFGCECLEKVLMILGCVERVEVDWSHGLTLNDAGMLVRDQVSRLYPDLSDLALDALVWKFTYDWR